MPRSLLARAALAAVVWIAGGTLVHVDQVGSRAVPPPAIRAKVSGFEGLQQWFEIVRAHEIGQWDQSARTMASTDPIVLAYIGNDLRMVRQLIEAAAVSRTTRISSPNNGKLLSLKSLAPLMGLTDDELDLPGDLTLLGDPENPARKVIGRIMIRAAVLHTRVATELAGDSPAERRAVPMSPGSVRLLVQQSAVRIQDGQQIEVADLSFHWAIAREALDLLGPPPASSPVVRAWYDATLTYLQAKRLYNALQPHLEHARLLFPNDGAVFLFSGAVAENLALPKVQAAVLGPIAGVGKPADLLREAEKYYRRALELDPSLPLAKLRLGRVLSLTNRHDEAAQLLQAAETTLVARQGKYLAAMLLGRAEEARAHDDSARGAYLRAASLFAGAQSPRLALAALAWRRGEQDDALTQVRALASVNGVDLLREPWWRYDVCHIGDLDALLDRLDLEVGKAMR